MSKKSQRTVLKSQEREIISKVYDFMKKEAINNYAEKLTDARWRTAQAVGVSERTVTRILRERKEHTKTMEQTTAPAMEFYVPLETITIIPMVQSMECKTEPTSEVDSESENEATAKEELLQHEVELPKVPQEVIVSASSDTQAYPPDLLTFPLRSTSQGSPASVTSSGKDRVVLTKIDSLNSPNYRISPATPTLYSKFQNSNFQNIPFSNSKGYVTLPRRPRSSFPESALGPQIYSTLNGVIPYYDTFNMKLFGHGYYSINKSEMDLGPVNKSSILNASDDLEPAPSPAPGTPHANIPRNSLSSPNIHNQLMAQMTNGKREKALTVRLENNYPLRNSSADLKAFFNVSSGSHGRARGHKTSKRSSVDIKEQFLNTIENATEV